MPTVPRARPVLFLVLLAVLFAPAADAQLGAGGSVGGLEPGRPLARDAAVRVFDDALAPGWQDWSWSTGVAVQPAPALGAASLGVTPLAAWSGLYLHQDEPVSLEPGTRLRFALHGGSTGGQRLAFFAYDGAFQQGPLLVLDPLPAGAWRGESFTAAQLGVPEVGGLVWQEFTGGAQPAYALDAVRFLPVRPLEGGPVTEVPLGPALDVDVAAAGTPISEGVYGTNFVEAGLAAELGVPVRRFGGNHVTRYNWLLDVSNRGSDWFFENIAYPTARPELLPDDSTADRFVADGLAEGLGSIITVPLIGWTPKSRELAGGFAVSQYGPQQFTDPFAPDLGNGVALDGSFITGNDPADTSVPITSAFVADWVTHLVGRFGTAAQGGVGYYALDNEPMLWHLTHRDVHPQPASYDELWAASLDVASAVKDVDPTAKILGPVSWGWTAYSYSALDQAPGGAWWLDPQDQLAHGGTPLLAWYLQQMADHEQQTGQRLLDLLDVHAYPEAPGVVQGLTDPATNALRLRATRALWDPTYVDESWIGEAVLLVPRMRQLVADHYPGTGLAVTEYSFGALDHLNGALAQAEVLGLLGREGVDMAHLWYELQSDDPGAFAFRAYRDYDGAGGRFGELSLPAASADADRVSVFAARRSDGALTLVLVNKTGGLLECPVELSGLGGPGAPTAAAAEHWTYGAADLTAIAREPDVPLVGDTLRPRLAGSSLSVLVLP